MKNVNFGIWINSGYLAFFEIACYGKATPKVISVADKRDSEQLRLIAQLNDKDKSTVMNIINTMLTKQKFQTFFE